MDDRRTNTQHDSIAYQRQGGQKPAAKQFSMKAISRRATVFHTPKGARRLFSTAWAFALLALVSFSASAQTLNVTPANVTVGSLVTVTGSGYAANQGVGQLSVASVPITTDAHLLSASVGAVSGNNIAADASGNFTVTFRAPITTGGAKTVNLTGATQTGSYTVDPRIIRFSPLAVKFGDRMTIVADGYGGGQKVAVMFGTHGQGEITANGSGQINGQITVGAAPYADGSATHPLHGLMVGTVTRPSAVGIAPVIRSGAQLNKTVGSEIDILAHGFPASTAVHLNVGREVDLSTMTNTAGSIQGADANKSKKIALPMISYGVRDLVLISGAAGTTDRVTSKVTNGLGVIPSIGIGTTSRAGVGTVFTLALNGFAHYKEVNSVNVIQTDNTGTDREAVTLALVQNGVVVAANVMTIDAATDLDTATPPVNAPDTGTIASQTYTLSATDAAALRSGVATLRATGGLSNVAAEAHFFFSSPADSPRLFIVKAADSTDMVTSVAPGGTLHLVGTSFPASAARNDLSMVRAGTSVALNFNATADDKGALYGTATVPNTVSGGTWTLSFAGVSTTSATINVVPTGPTVSPASATVGTDLTVGGSGFTPGETVTFNISPTTSLRVRDGSNSDTNAAAGAISAVVRLNDTPHGGRKISVTHSGGTTEGATLTVQSKITHVDGLSRDRANAPAREQVTKFLGQGLTIAGTGQAANSMLELHLDANRDGVKNAGDIKLETRGATSNANGTYNVTADLTSISVTDLGVYYQIFLVDPKIANVVQSNFVEVKFDSAPNLPIAAYSSNVKSAEGQIWVRGIAYDQNGNMQPGKNLGYLRLNGTIVNLSGNNADDTFIENGGFDRDTASGMFRIEFNTPQLAKGRHSLSLDGQTVYFNVSERAVKAAGPGNNRVPVGNNQLKAHAYGFGASEQVQVKLGDTVVGSATANGNGTAENITLTIPDGMKGGTYNVDVQNVSGSTKVANIFQVTVIPSIALSPDHGDTQTSVTVTGKGFRANEGVTFTFGGYEFSVGSIVTADANGAFTQTLNVPSASFMRDGVPVAARGNASLESAMANFVITADLRLADTQDFQVGSGENATVVGDGFASGDEISFSVGGKGSSTTGTVADANGMFTATVAIPESPGGIQTIRATATNGSRQIAQLTVNVTSSLQVRSGSPGRVGQELSVKARGFQNGRPVRFFVAHPVLGRVNANYHRHDNNARHVGRQTSNNGSTNWVRVYIPTLPRGTWDLVAEQEGGDPDPLTNATRVARTPITVTPFITKINGEGNRSRWRKRVTVEGTFRVEGSGFTAGSTITVKHTDANGQTFAVTNNTVGNNGNFNLTATVFDTRSGVITLHVADDKGGVATAPSAIDVGSVISVSPTSGVAGTSVITVTGSGFAPGAITFRFESGENVFTGTSNTTAIVGQKVVTFSGTLNPLAPNGYQKIIATDSLNVRAEAHLLVSSGTGLALTLNKTAAKVGDRVTATGTGYAANASYPVTFDGRAVTINSASFGTAHNTFIRTDSNGSFRFEGTLPNSPKGTQQQFRVGANHAVATIHITEKISVSAVNGVQEGGDITVSGTGFAPGDTLALRLKHTGHTNPVYYYTQSKTIDGSGGAVNESARVTLTAADVGSHIWSGGTNHGSGFRSRSDGSFTVTLRSPGVPLGDYRAELYKANSLAQNNAFSMTKLEQSHETIRTRVKTSLAISSSTVYNQSTQVGGNNTGQLIVSGTGFQAGQNVRISIHGWSTDLMPDADGSLVNRTVTITGAQSGTHDIRAESNSADLNIRRHNFHRASNRVSVASEIVVVPSTVSPGQSVTVYGFGFGNDEVSWRNGERVRIRVDGIEQGNHKNIVGSHGRFTRSFTIPAAIKSGNNLVGLSGGTVVVSAQGHDLGGGGYAEDSLTIIPTAHILNTSVAVGGNIEIRGYGFPKNTPILFYLDSSSDGSGRYVRASASNNTTNSRGGLDKALVVSQAFDNPNIFRHVRWEVQGSNTGSAVGAGNTTNTYTTKPSITVDPTTGRGGESILVVGNGFTPGAPVSVTVGGTPTSFVNATIGTLNGGNVVPDAKGRFTARFNAPAGVTTGVANVEVSGGGSAETHFIYSTPGTNRTLMVLGGGSGVPGTEVKIRGYNYNSFEPLGRIRLDHDAAFASPQLIRGVSKHGNGGWQVIGDQVSADVNGVFEVKFRTPENTSDSIAGTKHIDTENAVSETVATVTVTSSISRNPRWVTPGSVITITGKAYGPGQNLGKPSIDGIGALNASGNARDGNIITTANGTFRVTITVPGKGTAGVYYRDAHLKVQGSNVHNDALQIRNAQRLTSVSPKSGGSGTLVRVRGDGFKANERVDFTFDGKRVAPYDLNDATVHHNDWFTASGDGKIDIYFNVPPSDSGARQIWMRQYGGTNRHQNHRFTLTETFTVGASIAIRPVSGNVGDDVTVTGTGFGNKQYLTVIVGGVNISPTFRSNSDGSFNAKFKVPHVPGGAYTVTVGSASSKFTVGSTYKLSGAEAKVGQTLTVEGMGMKASSPVMIHLGNGQSESTATGANGSVSQSFTVQPTSSDRGYTATLVDSDGNTHTAGTWHAVAAANASPLSGNPGDEVTVSGSGFSRYERLRITIGGIGAIDGEGIPVDENGTLAGTTVRVPNLPPGATTLSVIGQALNSRGALNRVNFNFTVGSETGHVLTVQNISGSKIGTASPGDRIRVLMPEINTFQPNEAVTVTYPGLPVQTQTARPNGSMDAVSFTVPDNPGGMRTITAVGTTSGATRTIDFTVVPKVTLLVPSKFDLGDHVSITGLGAGANETLEVWIAPAVNNDPNQINGANEGMMVTIDSGGSAGANGRFTTTFRVLNALYTNNPQNVRIRVRSVGSDDRTLTSAWFGRAVTLQVVTKGVRVALSPASEGPGDAILTLEGTAADNDGNTRILENIGNVELAHGSILNGRRQKVAHADLEILDGIGEKEQDSSNYATIRTNLQGRFKARVKLTSLNGGKPMPSGLVTIYVGGELVTTSYTVKPELRLYDGEERITQAKLGQDYTLKGVSFSRTRALTLMLGGKAATTAALTTDGNGEFSTTVNWAPGEWVGGAQVLTATTQYDSAQLPLTILGTVTGVTAGTAVQVGDEVEVSGHGYGASEALTFSVGGNAVMEVEGGTTNADGTFTAMIVIPAVSSGAKDLRVSSATSDASVSGAYTIGPAFSAAAKANADTDLAVMGSGYGANEAVSVAVAGESPVTVNADANGSFEQTIPLTAVMDHGSEVMVTAGSQTASFLYDSMAEAQDIMASPNPAGSGKTVMVSANIEAGSTAMFSVAGVEGASGALEPVMDAEAPEGFMAVAGMYVVMDGADIEDAAVTVTVTDGIGNMTEHDGGALTIDTVAPMGTAMLSEETIRNNLSFMITATSEESGLTAMADVSDVDTTQVDAVALAESAEGGSYSAEVTVSQENEASPGDKMVMVTLTDAAGNSYSIEVGIELRANTVFTLDLNAGLNLIHVPVNEDGLDRASDLYWKINNGGDIVSAVVMLNDDSKFVSYTGGAVGSAVDLPLNDSTGVMVLMKQAASVTFTGGPLNESVPLRSGINLIGVPRHGGVAMASQIADLGQPNVTLTTLALTRDSDGNAQFIAVTPGNDVAVTGGQGFIVVASGPWALTMAGDPWENAPASTAASVKHLRPTSTPLLMVEGSLAREDTMAALNGLEVSVTNLRTGQKTTEKVGATAGSGRFSAAMLDLKGGRYEASDQFEVQIVDPSGAFGGIPKTRIVLSKENIESGRLDLGQLLLSAVPDRTALLPNYPNPFNPETWIPFQLAKPSRVTVTIYNAAGQTVRTLELGQLPAGTYHSRSKAAYWDGRNALGEPVASGLYIYRIEAGSFSQLRRMMILK